MRSHASGLWEREADLGRHHPLLPVKPLRQEYLAGLADRWKR
jgi:hypothetical protein